MEILSGVAPCSVVAPDTNVNPPKSNVINRLFFNQRTSSGKGIMLSVLGKSTKNTSANDLKWESFKRHPMK